MVDMPDGDVALSSHAGTEEGDGVGPAGHGNEDAASWQGRDRFLEQENCLRFYRHPDICEARYISNRGDCYRILE
jgi:hypothetical protein